MAENLDNIPAKITATATFYNTTGIIEKGKNIYFSPFLINNLVYAVEVRNLWRTNFNSVAFKDSDFTDIEISGWQPEDRELRVVANIAQFRARSGYYPNVDTALNYVIIHEVYFNASETQIGDQYYGYFIDSAKQAGRGSVSLSLSPDHFTNVFFLQNRASIASGDTPFDVFNPALKETYVERQHYDRVKTVNVETALTKNYTQASSGVFQEYQGSPTFDCRFRCLLPDSYKNYDTLRVDSVKLGDTSDPLMPIKISVDRISIIKVGALLMLEFYALQTHGTLSQFSIQATFTGINSTIVEDNLPVFSQIEEGFKYKRQYRDKHSSLNNGFLITEEEKEVIRTYHSSATLKSDYPELYTKLLRECCYFVTVVFKDNKSILSKTEDTEVTPNISAHPDIKNVGRTHYQGLSLSDSLAKVDFITHICPSYVSALLKRDIDNTFNHIKGYVRYYPVVSGVEGVALSTQQVKFEKNLISGSATRDFYISEKGINYILSNSNLYSEEIATAYLHKESSLLRHMSFLDSDANNEDIQIEFKVPYAKTPSGSTDKYEIANAIDMPYLCCFTCIDIWNTSITGINQQHQEVMLNAIKENVFTYRVTSNSQNQATIEEVYFNPSSIDNDFLYLGFGFLEYEHKTTEILVDLTEELNYDFSTDYYDPVLSFSPYSFYSLSYLSQAEVALNKQNYYENPAIKFYLSEDSLDSYKFTIVPEYEIDGQKVKYYSESMSLTLTNNLTVASSKLLDFIIANASQMKNQYAVNEKEAEKGFIEAGVMAGVGLASTVALMSNPYTAGIGAFMGAMTALGTGTKVASTIANTGIGFGYNQEEIAMNQKAKMADVGRLPANIKQLGTNVNIDLSTRELAIYLNHYRIDQVSYESICKYLERFGYTVNLFSDLHVNTRVGWDYIKLSNLDFNMYISDEQESAIRDIFTNGVTLLHNPDILHNEGHNYEYSLKDLYSE